MPYRAYWVPTEQFPVLSLGNLLLPSCPFRCEAPSFPSFPLLTGIVELNRRQQLSKISHARNGCWRPRSPSLSPSICPRQRTAARLRACSTALPPARFSHVRPKCSGQTGLTSGAKRFSRLLSSQAVKASCRTLASCRCVTSSSAALRFMWAIATALHCWIQFRCNAVLGVSEMAARHLRRFLGWLTLVPHIDTASCETL